MAKLPRFPIDLPLRGPALAALCAVYLLVGLVGHDPWKSDDATHFGIAYGFLGSHDWLVPRLAGETALETPPLYYWVAALCAKLFGGILPVHDAARLASGLFGAAFLALLACASRYLHDLESPHLKARLAESRRETGAAAILIAIGTLGLLVPIHDTQPMIALLAASAATYAGLALLPRRALAGGAMTGLGLGLGFLSSGLIALVTLAPLLLLLPLNRHWRSPASLGGLAVAMAVALPLCASWPLLLFTQTPDSFNAWWSLAAAGVSYQGAWLKALPDHAELLVWFAWPALPLALWALWLDRARPGQPAVALPLAGTLAALLALVSIYQPRPLPALPLLVPLILLAASGASRLRRGATNAFDWFGMMTFTLIAAGIWIYGLALTVGIPARLARHLADLMPGYVGGFSPLAYAAALVLSLVWLWLVFAGPRSPWRAATNWAAGMTLMWVLGVALWMPAIDYRVSYRSVALSLKQALPANPGCIAGARLGGAQRVSLQYFAGIATLRQGSRAAKSCPLLLEQGSERAERTPAGWRKIWEGHRPGDNSERLRLYRREHE